MRSLQVSLGKQRKPTLFHLYLFENRSGKGSSQLNFMCTCMSLLKTFPVDVTHKKKGHKTMDTCCEGVNVLALNIEL